jgi:hypothetical protein
MFVRELSLVLRLSKTGYFISGLKAVATLNICSSAAVTFMFENFLVFMMSLPFESTPSLYLRDKADLIRVLFTAMFGHLLFYLVTYINMQLREELSGGVYIFRILYFFQWSNVEGEIRFFQIDALFPRLSLSFIKYGIIMII